MTLPCCQTQACAKLTAPFTITDADLMQYPTESMYLYRQSHPESACESNDGAMGLLALNLHAINPDLDNTSNLCITDLVLKTKTTSRNQGVDDDDNDDDDDDAPRMKWWAILLVVVGSVLVICSIAAAAIWFYRRRSKRGPARSSAGAAAGVGAGVAMMESGQQSRLQRKNTMPSVQTMGPVSHSVRKVSRDSIRNGGSLMIGQRA